MTPGRALGTERTQFRLSTARRCTSPRASSSTAPRRPPPASRRGGGLRLLALLQPTVTAMQNRLSPRSKAARPASPPRPACPRSCRWRWRPCRRATTWWPPTGCSAPPSALRRHPVEVRHHHQLRAGHRGSTPGAPRSRRAPGSSSPRRPQPAHRVIDIRRVAAIAPRRGGDLRGRQLLLHAGAAAPLELGADVVVHSATKYLDGQGRVLGGAVVGSKAITDEVFSGSCAPPADPVAVQRLVILKGPGDAAHPHGGAVGENALELARWLGAQPGVARVCFYPRLESHPQHRAGHAPAKEQRAIVSFDVKGGGGGLEGGRRHPPDLDHRQPRRHQSTITHPRPPPTAASAPRRARHRRHRRQPAACIAVPVWKTSTTSRPTSPAAWRADAASVADHRPLPEAFRASFGRDAKSSGSCRTRNAPGADRRHSIARSDLRRSHENPPQPGPEGQPRREHPRKTSRTIPGLATSLRRLQASPSRSSNASAGDSVMSTLSRRRGGPVSCSRAGSSARRRGGTARGGAGSTSTSRYSCRSASFR